MSSWARRLTPVIPVFGRQRQGDFQKSKASLGHRGRPCANDISIMGWGRLMSTRPPEDCTQKVLTASDMRIWGPEDHR